MEGLLACHVLELTWLVLAVVLKYLSTSFGKAAAVLHLSAFSWGSCTH